MLIKVTGLVTAATAQFTFGAFGIARSSLITVKIIIVKKSSITSPKLKGSSSPEF